MTTDRSEQSGPEVVATVVHSESDASRVLFEQSCIALGCGEHPLITLSSHQQAVEALRAEVQALRDADESMQQTNYELHQQIFAIKQRAESAEARLARVAGLPAKWQADADSMKHTGCSNEDRGYNNALWHTSEELAAAIAPQEVR